MHYKCENDWVISSDIDDELKEKLQRVMKEKRSCRVESARGDGGGWFMLFMLLTSGLLLLPFRGSQ